MKVYKFGGASVRDAAGVRNLHRILSTESGELLLVVSAMGKTTNALEQVVEAVWRRERTQARTLWQAIVDRHRAIADELGLGAETDAIAYVAPLAAEWLEAPEPPADYDFLYDQLVSLGEILSTRIVSAYLASQGIDNQWLLTPDVLRTDAVYRDANVDAGSSERLIRNTLNPSKHLWIAQGFIGGTEQGYRTTLGREGSDYTAALMANMLDAESVTIWKDVRGIYNADPRLVADTTLIPALNYFDAVELAYSGAQVIHPKTIRPLENKRIPLYVRCFADTEAPGSVINADAPKLENLPVYIWRKNQVLITMRAKDFGFILEESLSDIFAIIRRYRLKVSLIQSSAVTISVSVDKTRNVDEAIRCLSERYSVTYNVGLALLTIRGTTPENLERAKAGREILLCQTTRRTAKLLVKEDEALKHV